MTIEKMREIKQEKGYSNDQISKLSKVPLGTVQKIFSGETQNPRYDTILALERIFTEPCLIRESPPDTYGIKKHSQGSYTLDDYFALPEDRRVELIDGYFYDMASPTYTHQYVMGELFRQIANFIKEKKRTCIPLISPIDVQLDRDEKTMIQPDLIIVCDRNDKLKNGRICGAPDFVMEVVSPSSRKLDYLKKLGKYTAAGVREYWILDPKNKNLVTYFFEGEDITTIYSLSDSVPVRIYGGELVIDLTPVDEWICEMGI